MYYFVEFEERREFLTSNCDFVFTEFDCDFRHSVEEVVFELHRSGQNTCDFYYVAPGWLGMNERAKCFLDSLAPNVGEFIQVTEKTKMDVFLLSVQKIVDALDKEASDIKYFNSSEKVMRISHYVFKPLTETPLLFKIPETARSEILCSEAFVNEIKQSGLRGLRFATLT